MNLSQNHQKTMGLTWKQIWGSGKVSKERLSVMLLCLLCQVQPGSHRGSSAGDGALGA